MKTWRTRLRERRKLKGITQEQLGELLGVGQSVVTMWETGRRYPEGEDTFERMASVLGCNPAWLRYGAGAEDRAAADVAEKIAMLGDAERQTILALIESLNSRRAAS